LWKTENTQFGKKKTPIASKYFLQQTSSSNVSGKSLENQSLQESETKIKTPQAKTCPITLERHPVYRVLRGMVTSE
jgi:hypothetical protein